MHTRRIYLPLTSVLLAALLFTSTVAPLAVYAQDAYMPSDGEAQSTNPLSTLPGIYANLTPEQKAVADSRMYMNYWGSPQWQIESQFGDYGNVARQYFYEQARSNPEWSGLTVGEQMYYAGEVVKRVYGLASNPFNTEAGVAANRQEKTNDITMKQDTGGDFFDSLLSIVIAVATVYITGGLFPVGLEGASFWGGVEGALGLAENTLVTWSSSLGTYLGPSSLLSFGSGAVTGAISAGTFTDGTGNVASPTNQQTPAVEGGACYGPANSCGQVYQGIWETQSSGLVCSAPTSAPPESGCSNNPPVAADSSTAPVVNLSGNSSVGGTGGTGNTANSTGLPRSCIVQRLCSGSDVYARSANCADSFVENCPYGCSSGECNPLPSAEFIPFTATNVSGSFMATGHLQARPVLVRSGDPSWLYWNVINVSSCSVSGTNGDSWTGLSSGTSGKTSSPIVGQTTYTLLCTAPQGATPSSIRETQTVNAAPIFRER